MPRPYLWEIEQRSRHRSAPQPSRGAAEAGAAGAAVGRRAGAERRAVGERALLEYPVDAVDLVGAEGGLDVVLLGANRQRLKLRHLARLQLRQLVR